MLIYHSVGIKSKGLKNERKKSVKKTYKSVSKRKGIPYSSISAVGEGTKKSKVSRKKKNISKKNVRFLEGLGLKVKQKKR